MFDRSGSKILTFLTLISFFAPHICDDICTALSPCICVFPNGSSIDITSLGNKDGTPRFLNVPSTNPNDTYTYSYNPCYPATFHKRDCDNFAVCQKSNGPEITYYNLGEQTSAKFYFNKSQLTVNYTSSDRTAMVKLVCTQNENKLTMEGEYPRNIYSFTLHSPCACPNGCAAEGNTDDALSTGSILVILLFVFVLVYVVGGVIYQKMMKGATGRELVPNYEFWMDFPLLVRDGVVFFCNGCQSDASYDRI